MHDPAVRAAAIADLARGDSIRKVARRYKAGSTTVKRWWDDHRAGVSGTHAEIAAGRCEVAMEHRRARFDVALDEFLLATVTMLHRMAEVASDPEFIRTHTADANLLAHTVFDKAERIVLALRREPEPGADRELPSLAEDDDPTDVVDT